MISEQVCGVFVGCTYPKGVFLDGIIKEQSFRTDDVLMNLEFAVARADDEIRELARFEATS
jgi:hypothetical protein